MSNKDTQPVTSPETSLNVTRRTFVGGALGAAAGVGAATLATTLIGPAAAQAQPPAGGPPPGAAGPPRVPAVRVQGRN